MNQIVTYLESKQAIFHGALVLMMLYEKKQEKKKEAKEDPEEQAEGKSKKAAPRKRLGV